MNVEFWSVFILAWLVVVVVVVAIFKDAGDHERIWDFELHFSGWSNDSIRAYIKTVEKWVKDGIADPDDLDHLAAAKIVLERREQTK